MPMSHGTLVVLKEYVNAHTLNVTYFITIFSLLFTFFSCSASKFEHPTKPGQPQVTPFLLTRFPQSQAPIFPCFLLLTQRSSSRTQKKSARRTSDALLIARTQGDHLPSPSSSPPDHFIHRPLLARSHRRIVVLLSCIRKDHLPSA